MIKTLDELNKVRAECRSMVTKRALISAAAAVVPVPGVDIVADVGLLQSMIPAINKKFHLTREQIDQLDSETASKISMAIKDVGSNFVGKVVTKELIIQALKRVGVSLSAATVAKYVPIVGSAISSSVSFGIMRRMGVSHINDCYEIAKSTIS